MRHGSPRLGRVGGRFRNRLSEGNHDTAEASIRNSRIGGYPEPIENPESLTYTELTLAVKFQPLISTVSERGTRLQHSALRAALLEARKRGDGSRKGKSRRPPGRRRYEKRSTVQKGAPGYNILP
jgi:hypothetical protein